VEQLPNPKSDLHGLIEMASEQRGRKLRKVKERVSASVHQVAGHIQDFSPLRGLTAFVQFERRTRTAMEGVLAAV
jgi:hypothetical protein